MTTFLLFISLLSTSPCKTGTSQVVFKDSLTYEVPEAIGFPRDFTIDIHGKTWLVDGDGHLLVWDKRGQLVHELGGRGQGPGEFDLGFQSLFISGDREEIVVCDSNKFSFFSLDGQFKRFENKPPGLRKRFHFFLRTKYGYLISYNRWIGEREQGKLMCRIIHVDDRFSLRTVIREDRDWTWSKSPGGGWHWQPYAARFELAADPDTVFIARSDEKTITPYNYEGMRLEGFQVKIPLRRIDHEDRVNLRSSFKRGNRTPNDKITFPEYDSRIDRLITLDNGVIMVYQYADVSGLHQGVIVNSKDGLVLGAFKFYLGSAGQLMADKGALLMIRPTKEGGFDIRRVLPVFNRPEAKGPE